MTLRRIVARECTTDVGAFLGEVWGAVRSRVVLECGHAVENVCRPQTPHDRIVYAWDLATPRGEMECRECDPPRPECESESAVAIRLRERARIVAWLRKDGYPQMAERIERGDHMLMPDETGESAAPLVRRDELERLHLRKGPR